MDLDADDRKKFGVAVRQLDSYGANIYVNGNNAYCIDFTTVIPKKFRDRADLQEYSRAVATMGGFALQGKIEDLISMKSGKVIGWKLPRKNVTQEVVFETTSHFGNWLSQPGSAAKYNKLLDLRAKATKKREEIRKTEQRLRRKGRL